MKNVLKDEDKLPISEIYEYADYSDDYYAVHSHEIDIGAVIINILAYLLVIGILGLVLYSLR